MPKAPAKRHRTTLLDLLFILPGNEAEIVARVMRAVRNGEIELIGIFQRRHL